MTQGKSNMNVKSVLSRRRGGIPIGEEVQRRLGQSQQRVSARLQQRAAAAAEQQATRRRDATGSSKGASGRGAARIGRRMALPPHVAPSRVMKTLYPWVLDPGLGIPGGYIGPDLYTGASFLFDPFELYTRKVISAPNIVLAGVIGSGKSAFQKSLILRCLVFGVRFSWVQVKPEYDLLCAALGIEPLRCGPGQLVSFNPLAEVRRHPAQTTAEWLASNRVRRISLLDGILTIQLGRPVTEMEKSALGWALDSVTGESDSARGSVAPVSLPTLLAAMVNARAWGERARELGITPDDALRQSQEARLALAELVNGSLRGMFDSTDARNRAFDATAPGTLLDLSAVRQNQQLTVLAMVCAQSAMEAELMHPDAGHRIIGYDEAWMAMRYLALLRRMQEQWKLARMYGITNLLAFHRYSDMEAVGDQGSEARKLAEGLLADSDIKITYRQAAATVSLTRELMGLSATEAALLKYLRVGVGLWKIGANNTYLVKHQLSPLERPLVDTDSRMDVVEGVDDVTGEDWDRMLEQWAAEAAAARVPTS